jgi:hypothetical protein
LTLTSGLLSSFLIPLIGMVMNGMVNPSSTYNTHSKLRTNEIAVSFQLFMSNYKLDCCHNRTTA